MTHSNEAISALFHGDYKAAFNDAVTDLIAQSIEDRGERMLAVQALIDAYIDSIGDTPDATQLERLTDYILREELTDTHPDKMARNEYPIMSDRQEFSRRDREYSLDLADNYDLDGTNRAKPERRHRIAKEERFIDKASRAKNRKRNAQYKRDTSAGDVVSYNLRDTGGEFTTPEFVQSAAIGYEIIPSYYRK